MHSTNCENIGIPAADIIGSDQCVNNLKRKSYYELSAVVDDHSPPASKIFKPSYEDHHHHQHHHQHTQHSNDPTEISVSTDGSSMIIDTTTNDEHMEFIDKYIVDHSNGTVELVNIMFDNNHLMPPVVQHNTAAAVMSTDGNFINYNASADTSSWTNVELLDLDHRGYYYSTIDGTTEECLVSQEKQSMEITTTVPS